MTAGKSILVVEDESDIAHAVRYHLEKEGYDCRLAQDGETALAEFHRSTPDLVVLDRMLPRMSGDEVLRKIRNESRGSDVPVIMLTAKVEETDELVGFALGADDYVRKPFSMKLLAARISASLRRGRSGGRPKDVLSSGPVALDRARHEVMVDGRLTELTATEFRILAALMSAEGRVLSRGQLIDSALGQHVAVTDRTMDVHVAALRKKLESAAACIRTVRGVGYTFRAPGEEQTLS
jgi:two-component system phosphate regulon response regulator PhoB